MKRTKTTSHAANSEKKIRNEHTFSGGKIQQGEIEVDGRDADFQVGSGPHNPSPLRGSALE